MTDGETPPATAPTRIGSRRGGGRAARRAARAAPLPENLRPVRAGVEGGAYTPLGESDVGRIHETALRALEEIGLADAPPSGIEALTSVGAELGDDGRVRIPRKVVEKMLAVAARDVTLHGQDPRNDLRPGGTRVHYGTAGAAVHVYDPALRDHRDPTMQDLYDSARLVDALDNIHFFQRTLTCRDTEDPTELDLNTLYVCISGTTKHVGTSFTSEERARRGLEMLHRVAGSESAWRARPFVSNSNCFVVPPLRFATESCQVMEVLIRGGMPILLLSAGQAGATAPASLAGAVAQAVAECLAGVVSCTSMRSSPAIRRSSVPGRSSPTFAPARCPAARGSRRSSARPVGKWRGTTTCRAGRPARCPTPRHRTCRPATSAGSPTSWPAFSGLNLVYESVGMHASLLSHCLESLVIDNDVLGVCLRCVRGIEVNDDTLALETMRGVCLSGPGHYLGHEQTLRLMQSEYVYPGVGDRTSPKEWLEAGKPELLARAREATARLLSEHFPRHVPDDVDEQLRAAFPILIPREAMRPPD